MEMRTVEVDTEIFALVQEGAVPLEDTFNSALRRRLGLDDSRAPGKSKVARGSGVGRRASPGSLLPEPEYWVPILRTLVAMGGSGSAVAVTEEVGRILKDRLTEPDKGLNSTGEVRWKSRTAFARNKLKDLGYIKPPVRRGIWEISEEGRRFLEEQGG
jgi:hypothetical protein